MTSKFSHAVMSICIKIPKDFGQHERLDDILGIKLVASTTYAVA